MVAMRPEDRRWMCFPLLAMLLLSGCSTATKPFNTRPLALFQSIWGTGPNDVYAVGQMFDGSRITGMIAHFNGTQWDVERHVSSGVLTSVWGASATDRIVTGYDYNGAGRVLHFKQIGNTRELKADVTARSLYAIWGSSATDVYAAGIGYYGGDPGAIEHFDGNTWTTVNDTLRCWSIWGSGPDDVFVLGSALLHFDGSRLTDMGPNAVGVSIWGSAPDDVFMVGATGTIQHYDGTSWTAQSSGTHAFLRRVWGVSASDVYAVGEGGVILHYNGSVWAPMASNTAESLTGIWGSSANDIYAVGQESSILHYDGSRWSAVPWNSSRDWSR